MRSPITWSALATIGLLLGSASVLPAQTFFQNTTGIASPALTITFDEHVLPTGSSVTNEYSDLGVTFSPNVYYSPQVFPTFNIDGTTVGNFNFNGAPIIVPFDIVFSTVQTDVGFAFITNPGTSTFEALLGGVVVATGTAATDVNLPNDFYGFIGGSFDTIRVTSGGSNNSSLLDNLQIGSASVTPEGSSLAMLAFGGLPFVIGFGRKLRRKTA